MKSFFLFNLIFFRLCVTTGFCLDFLYVSLISYSLITKIW